MTFLIIEDDKFLRELIVKNLTPVAKSIITASNWEEAQPHLKAIPAPNLITLDLGLPDLLPKQTLEHIHIIKQMAPDSVVVVLTGMLTFDQLKQAIEYGADAALEKSLDIVHRHKFLQTLNDVIRGLIRQPFKYQKNITLLEQLSEKIVQHLASK